MTHSVQLFINGSWCDSQSGKTIDIINPATEEVIGAVAHAEIADLELAITAAERGFEAWYALSAYQRYQMMRTAANILRERVATIVPTMSEEQGKPVAQAQSELQSAADIIDWFAEEGRRVYGKVVPARAFGVTQLEVKEPVGIVAAFTPWNFPVNQVVRKLSAALAAGCAIIIKAPEETPSSPAELIRAFADAGLPAGVINLIYGVPAEISNHLIPHPSVRKISFTGSITVGKQLAGLAGQYMKLTTMELGGHAPVIICEDADIELAVAEMCSAKFRNAGQVCIAPTRFLIHTDCYDRFVQRFIEETAKIKVGRGTEPDTTMGPLANERRIPVLDRMIKDAVQKGAILYTGGKRLEGKGYFFEPTILGEVPLEAEIMSEEPFGPVALMHRFVTIDEALLEANRLPYGLASYAYTNSLTNAGLISARMRAGMLSINHNGLALPEVHFGGIKDSGYGSEGGGEAIQCYLQTKLITQKAFF